MLKLSGTIILSVLTLSIAEPPVNNYLPPSSSANSGPWSGYPSSFETPTPVGSNPSYDMPGRSTGTHGSQAQRSGYSDSQSQFNPEQYSSFSQRPSQYRLNSHGPNNGYRNTPISPSYGPPNNQQNKKGNMHNQQPSLTYLPSQEEKPSSNNFNQYGPPAFVGQSGNHFNPPMNSYIPPGNAGSGHSSHGNTPSCQQKEQIPNSYGPPSNSMNTRPVSSSSGPPQNTNFPQYRPPSNEYLPANSQPQSPGYPSGYPQYPNTEYDHNNASPSNSFAPPVEDNNSSPPGSFDQAVPSQTLELEATEAPPLIKSKNFQNPSNSYTSYSDNSQYASFDKSSPIVVPNTIPMFGQKGENFGGYNTGYQPENRQNRLRQGLSQAQGRKQGNENYIAEVRHQANEYSSPKFQNMNAAQNGYSYDPAESSSGHGHVKEETGYRY